MFHEGGEWQVFVSLLPSLCYYVPQVGHIRDAGYTDCEEVRRYSCGSWPPRLQNTHRGTSPFAYASPLLST